MSYKEFWEDDPEIFWAYRFLYYKKQEEDLNKSNFNAWLNGLYVYNAISVSLSNAFKEKNKEADNYVKEPIDLFGARKKDEQEIINKKRMAEQQKIKERALQIENMLNKK